MQALHAQMEVHVFNQNTELSSRVEQPQVEIPLLILHLLFFSFGGGTSRKFPRTSPESYQILEPLPLYTTCSLRLHNKGRGPPSHQSLIPSSADVTQVIGMCFIVGPTMQRLH